MALRGRRGAGVEEGGDGTVGVAADGDAGEDVKEGEKL